MHHGILPLWKPEGMTSHDCVHRVRRLTGVKKIGHTGTLDPDVTGVLPLCLGQATRVAEYVQELPKFYHGVMTLGRSTHTLDSSGGTRETRPVKSGDVTTDDIGRVFLKFTGEIEQVPPMYSAVKVKGKRLYQLAREGKQVERKARKVMIYQLTLIDLTYSDDLCHVTFDVSCSKGTYIRVLCEDMGNELGFPAHMSDLIRTRSGPYTRDNCATFEELEQAVKEGTWLDLLYPVDSAVTHFPEIVVDGDQKMDVLDGKKIKVQGIKMTRETGSAELFRIYFDGHDGESRQFLALYRRENIDSELNGEIWLKPEKVFRQLIGGDVS